MNNTTHTRLKTLASWLEEILTLAGSEPSGQPLMGLTPLQIEQMSQRPGAGLSLLKDVAVGEKQDVTGTLRQRRQLSCLLRLRLAALEADLPAAENAARAVCALCEAIDRKGITQPADLGQEPRIKCTAAQGKSPGDDGLWEYRLGILAGYTVTIQPKGD